MSGPGLIAPDWPAPRGVRAAFTLRTGGVSAAPYDSLNMGAAIGDSPEAVAENRRLVREALRLPAEPVWLEQVHGTHVVALSAEPTTLTGGAIAAGREDAVLAGGRDATAGGAVPKGDAFVSWGPGRGGEGLPVGCWKRRWSGWVCRLRN
jgi:copper oxidase (laccase) domain-containing protein